MSRYISKHTGKKIDDTIDNVVNPNLLDNWYFGNPVDQRGGRIVPPGTPYYTYGAETQVGTTSTYMTPLYANDGAGHTVFIIEPGTGASCWVPESSLVRGYILSSHAYGPDRWFGYTAWGAQPAVVLIEEDGIRLTTYDIGLGSSSYAMLNQTFENLPDFINKTVTLSVLVEETTPNDVGQYPYIDLTSVETYGTGSPIVLDKVGVLSKTMPFYSTAVHFSIYIPAGTTPSSVKIKAVKLELGSQQTLAHQDENGKWVLNEIPDFGEQLAKCQRYQLQTSSGRYAGNANASEFYFFVPTPVSLRANPTLSGNYGTVVFADGSTLTPTSIYAFATSANGVACVATLPSPAPSALAQIIDLNLLFDSNLN